MNAVMPMTTPSPVKLRVCDYELLADAGAFDAYSKTELIDGEIVAMNAQFLPHAYAKTTLGVEMTLLLRSLDPTLKVVIEGAVKLDDYSQPEPDITVIRADIAGRRAMVGATVVLAVEVTDTTQSYDLGRKRVLYAKAGIPEYWVVDLDGERVHRFWDPRDGDFRQTDLTPLGDPIVAVTITGFEVAADNLR